MEISGDKNSFAGILEDRTVCCLPGLHLCCFSSQVSLLLGWFCHLPVDIRMAGSSPGYSRKQCLFVGLWMSGEERWCERGRTKRINKEKLKLQ